jgi:multiple sugar transport system substrate-binding protein
MKKLIFALLVSTISFSVFAADDAWWKKAGKPYKGTVLQGITENTPPGNFAASVLAKDFEKLTGIKVRLENTSWDAMYDKAIKDMEANSGIYDFVYIEQDIVYSYLDRDFLVNISKELASNPGLVAPGVSMEDFTTFIDYFKNSDGDVFGIPMEAFIKVYLYRKDLFEAADAKAAFRSQYGYGLAPATTFGQWRDNAEFFTGYCAEKGMQCWGTTVQGHTGHPASTYEFLESIAPSFGLYNWGVSKDYHSCVKGGGQLNGGRAKAALNFWTQLLPFAPPEALQSTWSEVGASFAAGRAAQGWVYGENAAWIATDSEKSAVVGKVGVRLPPTAEGVMQQAASGNGYIGYFDGGAYGIPHSSKNRKATMLWLQYISQNEVQADWAIAGGRITHKATYADPKVVAVDAKSDGYFTLMRDTGYLFAGAPEFPFHGAGRGAIDPFIYKALAGEITPEDALDGACQALDKVMKKLGYQK